MTASLSYRPRRAGASDRQAPISSRDRPIQRSHQSVALPNMEELGVFESREQLPKLSHVLPLSEPLSHEGPLLSEMSNAFLDFGLRTIELSF